MPDGEAADDVDQHDDDAGDGVAADKLAGAVHGTVEIGFAWRLGAAVRASGSSIRSGVQVRVDGHLLAGHGIQGETRSHLGDAPAPLVMTTKLMTTRMRNTTMPTM